MTVSPEILHLLRWIFSNYPDTTPWRGAFYLEFSGNP